MSVTYKQLQELFDEFSPQDYMLHPELHQEFITANVQYTMA